jgi:hypothetical protein
MKVWIVASFDQRNHLYEFDDPTIKIELVTFSQKQAVEYKEKWGEEVQLIEAEVSNDSNVCNSRLSLGP